ncbi:hypothetical protein BJ944DRAFT_240839 [Cunninghamella echinulata]|nr:hypothetical protein BJ944DRAFT_240839 [Cunninghamella echinulata]
MSTTIKNVIRPSSSLIVASPIPKKDQVKGQADYNTLMLKRNGRSSFVHAHVFPGGVNDKYDDAQYWQGTFKEAHKDKFFNSKICAIRETFEESGLLLSHPPLYKIPTLDIELWRKKVHDDASQFKLMCDQYQLTPAIDNLIPFANWITPVVEKKRYNTLFFLTVLKPSDKNEEILKVAADGNETLQFDWFTPQQALDQFNEKKIKLIPPQWYALHCLNQYPQHKDILENAGIGSLRVKSTGAPITILPQFKFLDEANKEENEKLQQGYDAVIVYPGDERHHFQGEETKDYICQLSAQHNKPGNRHRLYIKGHMEHFTLEKNVDVEDIIVKANL